MALKRFYDSEEEIPEGAEAHYVERNGRWELDTDAPEGAKTDEDVRRALRARDNEKAEREKLKAQLDEMQKRYEGIDPDKIDEIKEAQGRLEDIEHQRLIDEKKFEEAAEKKFERRLAEMQRNLDASQQEIQTREAKLQAQRNKLQSIVIEGALQNEFLQAGADPKKVRYLLLDAKSKWELDPETDEPVPIDYTEGGHTKVTAVGKDGKTLTMAEQVKSMLAQESWAVLESTGSGTRHQSATNGSNGVFQITEADVRDVNRYRTLRSQAEKAGAEIEVIPSQG